MTKPKTPYRPPLKQLIAQGQRRKQALLVSWGKVDSDEITKLDVQYWLIFIIDLMHTCPVREADYVRSWNVHEKIARLKANDEWPPAPKRNKHLLPMFRRAYNWPY